MNTKRMHVHESTSSRIPTPIGAAGGIRKALMLLVPALLALCFGPARPVAAAPGAQSSSAPLVLAAYYTWFDENTWTYDQLSDLPAELYASRDRGAMARHIEQAQQAGIDGFVVAWYGPNGDSNQTEPNLRALLDEAAARNFKIAVLFETDSPFLGGVEAITGALQHINSVHAAHPAYLRVDGRPVVFFWRPTIYDTGTWQGIRAQVDPGHHSIWISEGVDVSYLQVFDGHHLYSNTWNPPADLAAVNQKFANLVAQMRGQTGAYKYWVATVMPGYNDLRIRPNGGFAADREGGAYFQRAWQAAVSSAPDWIIITSFNEWPEGSYIEPSAAYGRQYLDLAAAGSAQFKAGGGAQVPAAPRPEPAAPTAYVNTPLLNLRAGPSTDTAIMGQVVQGTALPITGRHAADEPWWQVKNEEQTVWVYGPLLELAGPLTQVPVVAAE
ncbi:MAG: glycoside hydrolase family 99-like domain-containing protein [Caldilineaceae bacterium]|nr:glycoside hydrolase family 99-like domain-containing protein [Caldilineaceae bacterium]